MLQNLMLTYCRRLDVDVITTLYVNFLAETTLGIQVKSQMEPELPFLQAFENCCQIDAKRIFQPWRYNDTVNKIINNGAFRSYARSKEMIWKFMHKVNDGFYGFVELFTSLINRF